MKKIIKSFILSLLFVPFISGCKAPVFYEIMRDVAPEEATVNGVINSITRYKSGTDEKLVTYSSDGLIWKDASGTSHGQWSKVPGNNSIPGYIIKTAADQSNLYVISVTYREDVEDGLNVPDAYYLRAYNGTSWSSVTPPAALTTSNFNMFCTNDETSANRSAYLRIGSDVYKLNGTSTPASTTTGSYNSAVYCSFTPKDNPADSKLNKSGNVYFFASSAAISDNVNNKIYWAEGSKLYYADASTEPDLRLDAGVNISCLAVTADSILIGKADFTENSYTKGGVSKTSLTAGVPGTSLEAFTTNATSQLASSYQIYTLLCVDSSKNETAASIYASMGFKGSGSSTSVSYNNIGLWSYYPTRGNWNRE